MINIILCGGVGSRLWPLSRTHLPKQFARILGGESLFEATVRRNAPLADTVLVASNRDQSFLAANQLRAMGIHHWKSVVEPVGRNTAPAIALACMDLDPSDLVLVTPSDHFITKPDTYIMAVRCAMELARQGSLVTFGIHPDYPETAFGYIEALSPGSEQVSSFREKPDAATAQAYIASGRYYWNSGIFCFQVGTYLTELGTHAPRVLATAKAAWQDARTRAPQPAPLNPDLGLMQAIPSISVDYAVLEKSSRVVVVPCDIGWSDLGSFDAVYDHAGHNVDGSSLACASYPIGVKGCNNLISNGEQAIALVNVDATQWLKTRRSHYCQA